MPAEREQYAANRLPKYKKDFIDLLRSTGALKVGGAFNLKDKKESPYIVNIGEINTGAASYELGRVYAATIRKNLGNGFDLIYAIPDKGTGLERNISTMLWKEYGMDKGWFFTRKVPKPYCESTGISADDYAKANVIGRMPGPDDRIAIVDDVFSSGITKYDTLVTLSKILERPQIVALVVAADRQEVGKAGKSAIEEFTKKTRIPVYSVIKALDIYQYLLDADGQDQSRLKSMAGYLWAHGTAEAKETLTYLGYEGVVR